MKSYYRSRLAVFLIKIVFVFILNIFTTEEIFAQTKPHPNFIIILCDDLGYGDIDVNGGLIPTPHLRQMAQEGLVGRNYYSAANLCTPSRAGLLTGRYAVRMGLGYEVILNGDERRLPLSEKTVAAVLKPDYVSGLFGKWHLGNTGDTWLPIYHGFDKFYGIPYSHDIFPLSVYDADAKSNKVVVIPPDTPNLQQLFYSNAEKFIIENRSNPFFVELALSAPHLPEYPQAEFKRTSKQGPYGDVISEIDVIVGRLLNKLKELKLDQNTIVIFTSDNGPWYEGSTGPLRDRKGGASYDGGYHVPFIAWAPGRIKAGSSSDAIISGVDYLPTFCKLAGLPLPAGVELDGLDISGVLLNGTSSPHDEIVLFNNEDVVGIRTQRWKYADLAYYRSNAVSFSTKEYKQLYDMDNDKSESYSVAVTYPDITLDLQDRLQKARLKYAPYKKGIPPLFKKMIIQRLEQLQRQD
jgi:arylsulfatase A